MIIMPMITNTSNKIHYLLIAYEQKKPNSSLKPREGIGTHQLKREIYLFENQIPCQHHCVRKHRLWLRIRLSFRASVSMRVCSCLRLDVCTCVRVCFRVYLSVLVHMRTRVLYVCERTCVRACVYISAHANVHTGLDVVSDKVQYWRLVPISHFLPEHRPFAWDYW